MARQVHDTGSTREDGVAIILAMLFVVITAGMVASGTVLMKAATDRAEVRFRRESQATQFAQSGLTEVLSWLRRQNAQPVLDFKPLRDELAVPPLLDTDDPEIGLMREFEIADDIWGRYEVWREDESDANPTRLEFRRKYQCTDLSTQRGFSQAGNVWLVRSLGYVFQRRDPNKAWNELPNRVLAMATLECEAQRLTLKPPAPSALSVRTGTDAHINTKGRVRGGTNGAGIFYKSGTGTPTVGPAADNRVTGTPSLSTTNDYDDSIWSVFGVEADDLRSMADLVITNEADFPEPIPSNSIIFAEMPSMKFDANKSLKGTGIVFFKGNLTLTPGNHSNFNGLLYVDGQLTIRENATINGAVVCTGNLTIQGAGDFAVVNYDDEILAALRVQIGNYRWAGAFRPAINQE